MPARRSLPTDASERGPAPPAPSRSVTAVLSMTAARVSVRPGARAGSRHLAGPRGSTLWPVPQPVRSTVNGRHLGALDGIRGLAAVAVVVTHVGFQSGASFRGMPGAFAARAEIGVAIFFVLSGFLLYRPFAAAHASSGSTPAVGSFLWKRALRIFPAYVVVLAVVLLVSAGGEPVCAWSAPTCSCCRPTRPASCSPSWLECWTLSTEVAWYLFLPVLGAVLLRRPAAGRSTFTLWSSAVCALLVAVSIGYAVVVRGGGVLDPFMSGYWLPHYLGWFALGVAMAVLHVRREQSARPQMAIRPRRCSAVLLGAGLRAVRDRLHPRRRAARPDRADGVGGVVPAKGSTRRSPCC